MEPSEVAKVTPLPSADARKPESFESARRCFVEHFGKSSGLVVVDASEASAVDVFGIQVLPGAAKWASARERTLPAVGAPESLRALCRGLGLSIAGIEEHSA